MAELQQVVCTIEATCRRLSIGQTAFHRLVKDGQLRVIKIGRRTLVPETEIQRLVVDQLAAQPQAGEK